MSTYVLLARNPVNGRLGVLETRLSQVNETNRVTVVERGLAEIQGTVITGDGSGLVPACA